MIYIEVLVIQKEVLKEKGRVKSNKNEQKNNENR